MNIFCKKEYTIINKRNFMFVERLKEKFGENNPIFTYEILETFKEYTKAYVFRMLNKSLEKKEIIKYCAGVYYIPSKTRRGLSTIIPEDIINKKYITNDDDIYGIYSGLLLRNLFNQTAQVPNTIEIVTNNESSRSRKITINNRDFILKKSRCKITKENYKEYMILELLSNKISITDVKTIKNYMEDNKITLQSLLEIAKYFPSSTLKKMLYLGIL